MKDAQELAALKSDKDSEMRQLAEDELVALRNRIETNTRGDIWRILSRRVSEVDKVSALGKKWTLEVYGRAGGEEAGIFAAELFTMYKEYAKLCEWKFEDVTEVEHEAVGKMTVEGDDAYTYLKHEIGTHRVQRVPTTEASGRMQTSTASRGGNAAVHRESSEHP